MKSLDVGLELSLVHPPDAPPADLYGGQGSRSHQSVDLRHADAQVRRHVFESEKAGLDRRAGRVLSIFLHGEKGSSRWGRTPGFDRVCFHLRLADRT